ncbi:MAG TPA: hypothetical protein VGP95_16775, partial [Gemmatimonadaceae bacterium]|nr:hypothetical protein [Gemmatimonadaceae bacterium]
MRTVRIFTPSRRGAALGVGGTTMTVHAGVPPPITIDYALSAVGTRGAVPISSLCSSSSAP